MAASKDPKVWPNDHHAKHVAAAKAGWAHHRTRNGQPAQKPAKAKPGPKANATKTKAIAKRPPPRRPAAPKVERYTPRPIPIERRGPRPRRREEQFMGREARPDEFHIDPFASPDLAQLEYTYGQRGTAAYLSLRSIEQLRDIARELHIRTGGTKRDLAARILRAYRSGKRQDTLYHHRRDPQGRPQIP